MTPMSLKNHSTDLSRSPATEPAVPLAASAPPRLAPFTSKKALWTGRILTALVALFLLFDAGAKLLELPMAVEGTVSLGYPASAVFGIGVVGLVCLVLYLIPRTAVLGAILWTGYLGGAIATHVRVNNPLFSHTLFPIYVGAFLWAGLWLRDARLRSLVPFRSAA